MVEKELKATLETRTSKKGNVYQVIVIRISDNLEKLVFLDKAEIELLKLINGNSTSDFSSLDKFPTFGD